MHEYRSGKRITALSIALLGLLFASAVWSQKQSKQNTAAEDHPPLFRLATAKWSEPYNGPLGYPKGAQRASLVQDQVTCCAIKFEDLTRKPSFLLSNL